MVKIKQPPRTHHDVGRLDLLLLRGGAAHRLLELEAAADGAVDGGVEEDEQDVGQQLRQDRLRPEVVVDDVVLAAAHRRRTDDRPVVHLHQLENR